MTYVNTAMIKITPNKIEKNIMKLINIRYFFYNEVLF
jgi:hypothetical protein